MGDGFIVRRGGKLPPEPFIIEEFLVAYFYGAVEEIPEGWQLCDGTNSTPDLRNKFVLGAGDEYIIEETGGFLDSILLSHTHTVTSVSSEGSHNHTGTTSSTFPSGDQFAGRIGHTDGNVVNTVPSNTIGLHSHTVTTSTEGESPTNKNLHPYHSLHPIIKLEVA